MAFGSVSYNRHCAFQNVVELRDFIQTDFAHEAAEWGDAGVVVARECRTTGFGIDIHAAEFVHLEWLAHVAYALLGKEYGPGAGTFD